MEELEYSLENEEQFWAELDDIVGAQCDSHEVIDNALRSYLLFTTNFKDEYLHTPYDLARCSEKLVRSQLFQNNSDYVRRQIVYSLLQEEDVKSLHVIAGFLLFDGRQCEGLYEMMNGEGAFGRLVELIRGGGCGDKELHRGLLHLLYEMCRVHRLGRGDLELVDDGFVVYLFQIIEQLSDDVDDPYHYPVIRVLLVLNEQYMVLSAASTSNPTSPSSPTQPPLTNRVIKILSTNGPSYMTFGENIILLLNRETETSLQLLILKLLYLLFTNSATKEYFYTNDLRVLLDVIIRNLLDLPDNLVSLRHTYLRVLYPLLAYTQLSEPPWYKKSEILKTLGILGGSKVNHHFAPVDETTVRLVERVATVEWLRDQEDITKAEVARRLLGMSLSKTQGESSVSVLDVAAVTSKPGVKTPSRKDDHTDDADDDSASSNRSSLISGSGDMAPPPPRGSSNRSSLVGSVAGDMGPPPPRVVKIPPTPPPVRLSGKVNGVAGKGQGVNGLEASAKKLPPKAPPRRRTGARKVVDG